MFDPAPTLKEPILEIVHTHPIDLVPANVSPLLDQSGNFLFDDNGNVIHD